MIEFRSKKKSFSQKLKDELMDIPTSYEERRLLLAFALMTTAKFHLQNIRYGLAYRPFVQFLKDSIAEIFNIEAKLIIGKGISSIEIKAEKDVQTIQTWLDEDFVFDYSRGRLNLSLENYSYEQRRIILRSLYLSCGSLAEPTKAYHLEFSMARLSLAEFTLELLESFTIRGGILKRYGYNVIYVKDADHIADVLALIGASASLLQFEAGRVDKEVNNSVNRVVNCDNANARRIADSSARQMDLLERLRREKGFEFLPENLRETAESRLNNPGLSIAELGAIQTKAIGKSGMYHRLKKLEMLAEEELCL